MWHAESYSESRSSEGGERDNSSGFLTRNPVTPLQRPGKPTADRPYVAFASTAWIPLLADFHGERFRSHPRASGLGDSSYLCVIVLRVSSERCDGTASGRRVNCGEVRPSAWMVRTCGGQLTFPSLEGFPIRVAEGMIMLSTLCV